MLSPASLRVCCLAVMAPALTKADRQADCLPVVLSESFCVSKLPDTYNREDKIGEISLKCAYSSEYALNKKKPFMHRACWRPQKSGSGFLNKYRYISFDSPKSLLCSGRVRALRDARLKSWPSTNAITAYAGKIKLKYTMSKNTLHTKNMGLAKANTSLGLQSLKKVKHFSKENHCSGPNVMEDSLNFSDSTDSTAQMGPLISDITVLATNSESGVLPKDTEGAPCVNNSGRASEEESSNVVVSATADEHVSESVLEKDSQSFLISAGTDLIGTMDTSNPSVTLTDILCSTVETVDSARETPVNSVSELPCSSPSSSMIDGVIESEATEIPNNSMVLHSSANDHSYDITDKSESSVPLGSDSTVLQPVLLKEAPSSVFRKFMNFQLPVLNSKFPGTPLMASSLFTTLTCSKLKRNACKLSNASEEHVISPLLVDCRFGLNYFSPVRKEKRVCCLPSNRELESLALMLADKYSSVSTVVTRSTLLLRKQMNAYAKKQITSLVEHYQRKYQIPCQKPTKYVNTKSGKDLVDLKAELLQSEDVKNMSTAALVSLVRKLESSGSQGKISSPKMSNSSPDANESITLNFEPDDCEDIKHTSGIMLSNLKSLLKLSDPYFTDSSDEEYTSETDEDETMDNDTNMNNKCALWKYLTDRAALASSSTWLLARHHELDYRIKEYDERWSEIVKVEGQVSLEEPATSQNSFSHEPHRSDEGECVKPTSAKGFLALNGFLDQIDASYIARTSVSDTFFSELESSLRTVSDKEVEGYCCRTKPLDIRSFRKRKLAFIPGLYASNPKFSRLSTVSCYCNSQSEMFPCILCTGQYNSVQSVDPDSMALRDRIALLDPYFHPVLSSEKDIPICLQLENFLKIEAKYRNAQPVPSLETNVESEEQQSMKPKFSDLRSHRKLSRYARSLSAKYRNKHHRNSRHLRKHKLVFGKWRRLNNKHTLRTRTRFRTHSIASSGSDPDSPVHSPMSVFDDGYEDKRQDKFDIDDVIIPYNSRRGRLVNLQYKEIITPSWRSVINKDLDLLLEDDSEMEDTEDITEPSLIKKHALLEVEEKERMKRNALGLSRRRRNRFESRADSSGANTPDPTSIFSQESMFHVPNFTAATAFPASPASPATPNSTVMSDDSQPAFGNGSNARSEKKKLINPKRPIEESTSAFSVVDYEEVSPFEPLQFPLSDEIYEALLAESDHDKEEFDLPSFSPNYPVSPISSSSSTSTVEEEEDMIDDVTDPEWTVVKPMRSGPEQALVLKFAKR